MYISIYVYVWSVYKKNFLCVYQATAKNVFFFFSYSQIERDIFYIANVIEMFLFRNRDENKRQIY